MAKRLINIIRNQKVLLSLVADNITFDNIFYHETSSLLDILLKNKEHDKSTLLKEIEQANLYFKEVKDVDDVLYTLPFMIDLDEEILTRSPLHLEEIREEDASLDLIDVSFLDHQTLVKRIITFEEFHEIYLLIDHILNDLMQEKVTINNRFILSLNLL